MDGTESQDVPPPELPCIQRSMFVTYFLDPKL